MILHSVPLQWWNYRIFVKLKWPYLNAGCFHQICFLWQCCCGFYKTFDFCTANERTLLWVSSRYFYCRWSLTFLPCVTQKKKRQFCPTLSRILRTKTWRRRMAKSVWRLNSLFQIQEKSGIQLYDHCTSFSSNGEWTTKSLSIFGNM